VLFGQRVQYVGPPIREGDGSSVRPSICPPCPPCPVPEVKPQPKPQPQPQPAYTYTYRQVKGLGYLGQGGDQQEKKSDSEKTTQPQKTPGQLPDIIGAVGEAIKGIIEAFKGTSRYQYQYQAEMSQRGAWQALFGAQQVFAYVILGALLVMAVFMFTGGRRRGE